MASSHLGTIEELVASLSHLKRSDTKVSDAVILLFTLWMLLRVPWVLLTLMGKALLFILCASH